MNTPRLALNFTTGVLDSSVTFTRATSASNPATYVASNGFITAATNNEPRFDYNPVTLACKGLLIEESRSNLLQRSDDFGNAYWTKTNSSITPNATVAPDNALTGDKIVEAVTVNSAHRIAPVGTAWVSGTTYTLSIYVKKAERNWIRLRLPSGGFTNNLDAYFDLNTGVVGSVTSPAKSVIESAGNGWYRCSIIAAATVTATSSLIIDIAIANNIIAYNGDGTSGIYVWGAQVEAGSSATSYIPTTTTALTRNADVATITGTNFSIWWVASQGGVTANFRPSTVSGTRPIIQYDDGTANEIITLRGNTTNPELYIVDGGTPQAQIDAGTIAANTDYRLTGWWATNDCKAKLNSGAIVTDKTATIPTVTQARIGSDGTNYLNGTIASLNYYGSFTGQIYTRRKNKVIFSLM